MSKITKGVANLLLSKDARLHRAVSRGDAKELAQLIEQGADHAYMPKSGNRYTGDSPVHIAVKNNDPACLRVLIEHGAHLNSGGLDRQPPLACWYAWQATALDIYQSVENLPRSALEVGALLMEHGATLGSGGRGWVTPQMKIDRNPELARLQAYMSGTFQAEQQAAALLDRMPSFAPIGRKHRL